MFPIFFQFGTEFLFENFYFGTEFFFNKNLLTEQKIVCYNRDTKKVNTQTLKGVKP